MKTCLKPIVVPLQGVQQGGSEGRNMGFLVLGLYDVIERIVAMAKIFTTTLIKSNQ